MNIEGFKRVIAIPDVHGCYSILRKLVEQGIQFNPNEDLLIFLGDYIDFRDVTKVVNRAGVNSAKVVQYVSALKRAYPNSVVLLKGNHEVMAEKALRGNSPDDTYLWEINGGVETKKSYKTLEQARVILLPFIDNLQPSFEIPQAIFVHGNIPVGQSLKTATEDELLWDRGRYFGRKTLIVGHTVQNEIRHVGNKICLDLGCFMSGRLVGYDVLSGDVYGVSEDAYPEYQLSFPLEDRRN